MSKMDSSQIGFSLEERQVYTVSQLNAEVKQLLQNNFFSIWIEGELSNIAQPASGHIYFSLKDEQAQVRCAMFRSANRKLEFEPENGMHVLIRARVGLYEPRGEYQLTVEHMEEAGVGLLQRKFEALKRKLSEEGLFDEAHKQALPAYPRKVSVVTSASGAAVKDIISVLRRRYPILAIQIYAVPVQGDESANAIVHAIQSINEEQDCDLIILARGGGSIEDLWSFNEEMVARTIYASKLPIVTGIGHEIDFTIADFVADLRAPTPSLRYILQDQLTSFYQTIDWISQRLESLHPQQLLQRNYERLIELRRRAFSAIKLQLFSGQDLLTKLSMRFENKSPKSRILESDIKLNNLHKDLYRLITNLLEQRNSQLTGLSRTLGAVSPLGTLERGYAIVSSEENGQIIHNIDQVSENEKILIQLATGRLGAQISKKIP